MSEKKLFKEIVDAHTEDGQQTMGHHKSSRLLTISNWNTIAKKKKNEIMLKDFLISSFLYCYSYMSVHQYLSMNKNIDNMLIHLVDDHYSLLFMYMYHFSVITMRISSIDHFCFGQTHSFNWPVMTTNVWDWHISSTNPVLATNVLYRHISWIEQQWSLTYGSNK